LDVSDEAAVFATVATVEPALVINTAAMTNVDGCEHEPVAAHRVNALGPWWLARACRLIDATLVTISTDYVFGSSEPGAVANRRAWSEFDLPDPINAYGRSKLAGEELVRRTWHRHHIVRTAWVCGANGRNFVTTMLGLAQRHQQISVVDDQYGSPTYTRDLAEAVGELASSDRYGTWHRTNTGMCSWHDFAVEIFTQTGWQIPVERQSSDQLERAAARPQWSVLDNAHAIASGLMQLPPWQDGLRRLLDELEISAAETAG
ncbi:MAG: dTDP-4-dehydrorhamnose reductase, partial [Nitriliruptoraceae bacterium]